MKTYFSHFVSHLTSEVPDGPGRTTFRKAFRTQAEKMARCLQDKAPYTPFLTQG